MTNTETPRTELPDGSVVYLVQIGKLIKIGTTTNLKNRLSAFRNATIAVELLLTIPGGRQMEKHLHKLLERERVERELFEPRGRVWWFISMVQERGLEIAIKNLEETTAEAIKATQERERGKRFAEMRRNKAQKDVYFASLVAERKQRIGW